jgi:hypothetical protein
MVYSSQCDVVNEWYNSSNKTQCQWLQLIALTQMAAVVNRTKLLQIHCEKGPARAGLEHRAKQAMQSLTWLEHRAKRAMGCFTWLEHTAKRAMRCLTRAQSKSSYGMPYLVGAHGKASYAMPY